MKHIIWYNQLEAKFDHGDEDDFLALKEQYGRKILLKKTLKPSISKTLIQQVTTLLNNESERN